MVVAIVEHFLDDGGRKYFPEWVAHVQALLEHNENAISLSQVNGINVKTKSHELKRCIIEVKFKSLETLTAWVATVEHAEILSMLEGHALLERKTIIYDYQ